MTDTYESFSDDDLEREYSPSSMVEGDPLRYMEQYREESAEARRSPLLNADLSYGTDSGQILDFFRSPAGSGSPLHVFLHGGYWQELTHKQSAFMAPWFAERNVAFAAVNYNLAPRSTIGAMIRECRMALRWLANRHETLGIDPDRISVSGHSAGAHLLAMLLSDNPSEHNIEPPRICSATLISGIYDIRPIPRTYIDEPLQLTERQTLIWSPMLLKSAASVPVHIAVAEHDTPEFIRQAEAYRDILVSQDVTASYAVHPGRNHFDLPLHPGEIEALAGTSGHAFY